MQMSKFVEKGGVKHMCCVYLYCVRISVEYTVRFVNTDIICEHFCIHSSMLCGLII